MTVWGWSYSYGAEHLTHLNIKLHTKNSTKSLCYKYTMDHHPMTYWIFQEPILKYDVFACCKHFLLKSRLEGVPPKQSYDIKAKYMHRQ